MSFACLRINHHYMSGDAVANKRDITTLESAKAYVKRQCMKHNSIFEITDNISITTTLTEHETKKLHTWIEHICQDQFNIWKKARGKV